MSILNMMWLQQLLGTSTQNALRLVEHFGADHLYDSRHEEGFLSMLTLSQRRHVDASDLDSFTERLSYCQTNNIDILSVGDKRYPTQLFALENPPVLLYVRGNAKLLKEGYLMAVVGTRTPSLYGTDITKAICDELTRYEVTLVSGLATGLDSVAHRSAVAAGTSTIAVLGNGVDHFYPSANRELQLAIAKTGALVSEFPPTSEPFKGSFLMRNRIIAALSDALLVTEARERSGTMSTANTAIGIGRTVFAVPGNISTPMSGGTNSLIYDGATPVLSPLSLLCDCGFLSRGEVQARTVSPVDRLSPLAADIYHKMPSDPIVAEEFYDSIDDPIQDIMTALTELEMAELVDRLVGGYLYKKS